MEYCRVDTTWPVTASNKTLGITMKCKQLYRQDGCLFADPHNTYKNTLCEERRIAECLKLVVSIVTAGV